MHTRRTGGDNGYQTPEDFANQGRGYQPANNTDINSAIHDRVDTIAQNGTVANNNTNTGSEAGESSDNNGSDLNDNSKRPDWNDNTSSGWNDNGANWGSGDKKPTAEDKALPEERDKSREGYDNGSNIENDTTEDDHRYAASTGKMS